MLAQARTMEVRTEAAVACGKVVSTGTEREGPTMLTMCFDLVLKYECVQFGNLGQSDTLCAPFCFHLAHKWSEESKLTSTLGFFFLSTWDKLGQLGSGEGGWTSVRKSLHQAGLCANLWDIFLTTDWYERVLPTSARATSGQVASRCYRRGGAGVSPENKPVSSSPSWSLLLFLPMLEFLPWLSSVKGCDL